MMADLANLEDLSGGLLEFLIKASIAVLIGFFLIFMTRKLGPGYGHRSWMWVFSASLALPFLLLLSRWEVIPASGLQVAEFVSPAGGAIVTLPAVESGSIQSEKVPVTPVAIENTISWLLFFFVLWVGGVLILSIRSLIAHSYLSRLAKAALSPGGNLRSRLIALSTTLKIKRPVRLVISSQVQSPFTWGLFSPFIFLPTEAEYWAEEDIEMVLVHELEHIRRGDALSVMISRIFLVLNWVNPLAWRAVRHAVHLREEACDKRVLCAGYAADCYAALLFQQTKAISNPLYRSCSTAVAETGTIEQRIKMILKPTQLNYPVKRTRLVATVLPAVATLIILMIGVVGYAQDTPVEKEAKPSPLLSAADAEVAKKLGAMIVPSIEFSETPFLLAIDFLRARSEELDTATKDPSQKGVNIVIIGDEFKDSLITLKLKNVPMLEALRYLAALAQGQISIQRSVVVIEPVDAAVGTGELGMSAEQRKAGIELIKKKLSSIQIPSLELRDTPLREAIAFLQHRSMELDTEKDPNLKGINVLLQEGRFGDLPVTLKLKNLSLGDALYFTCAKVGLEYTVEPSAVVISIPQSDGDR